MHRAMSMSGGIWTESQADWEVMGSVLIWHMYSPASSSRTCLQPSNKICLNNYQIF